MYAGDHRCSLIEINAVRRKGREKLCELIKFWYILISLAGSWQESCMQLVTGMISYDMLKKKPGLAWGRGCTQDKLKRLQVKRISLEGASENMAGD